MTYESDNNWEGWLDGWVFKHSYLWLVYGGALPPYLYLTASILVALSVMTLKRKEVTNREKQRYGEGVVQMASYSDKLIWVSMLLIASLPCLLFCFLPPPQSSRFSFRLARFSGRQRSPPPAWESDEGLCLFVRLRSALQVSSGVCSAG